ncbi:MAG TPA: 7-carboxy-7-deazaguanine synthase QueE [Methanobacteriaceae archaeon]|nr:7-carboxy-7-deazaguanine synthase QueE [Methanobacteriaceae archaeon]
MKTRICEVFSSIQGEGTLLGRRQIFLRFSGCNLSCNYCDTPQSRDINFGEEVSTLELYQKIVSLKTPDLHSISLTGGEPLLNADFIRNFLDEYNLKCLLETNGSLPNELEKIIDYLDYASVDIKLPEHDAVSDWENLFAQEQKSINLLIDEGINTYCKVVVLPWTPVDEMGLIASKIKEGVKRSSKLSMVVQPSSPLQDWADCQSILLKISEETGKHLDVLTIPQVHKLLNLR